ncbi:hypothetical protein ES708_09119 [subsurface metagenome]
MSISFPSTFAITPFPLKVLKYSLLRSLTPLSNDFFTIASARGCLEFFSTLAVNFSSVLFSIPIPIISVTSGFPLVRVPVLSNIIVVNFSDLSRASPFLTRTPSSAPRPTPTVTAVGVARPSAHGQAITKTEIKLVNAKRKLLSRIKYQTTKERRAITNTIGIK